MKKIPYMISLAVFTITFASYLFLGASIKKISMLAVSIVLILLTAKED